MKIVGKAQYVIHGNHYDKYGTKNPIARFLMDGFLDAFSSMLPREIAPGGTILEVGCGEGHLLNRVAQRYGPEVRYVGLDLDPAVVQQARKNYSAHHFYVGSAYNVRLHLDRIDLVVCCEVLEHLHHPEKALSCLKELPCTQFVFSVPREPLWRCLNLCRLKYLRDLGNTPGHLQHWSRAKFLELINRFFAVAEVKTPLPWTMVRAVKDPRV